MKPKRFYFRTASIFSTPLKFGMPVFVGFTIIVSGLDAQGGDILRGGSASGGKGGRAAAGGAPVPTAADAARANARDTLARTTRTTRTMASIRAMQKAARKVARNNGANNLGNHPQVSGVKLPDVPNGLGIGGLRVSAEVALDPSKWSGAKLPKQKISKGKAKVTIKQTAQQALLEWETFNVGKKTTVNFDQSKGGENVAQWIAFNKVSDPSGNPSQILGNIKADGQVYLINRNGVIFGGGSRVNARGLTVSSLPINENLIQQGLLNNLDSQFLFSGLSVPGGSDGTPDFDPGAAPALGYGDVTVRKGAVLKTPSNGSGGGGRVMLVGANVTNDGEISTDAGQTILAAGLQVGITAHDSSDPSLRGIDVAVGDVGTYAGTVINSGIINIAEGSAILTGKNVSQLGGIDSTTSVSLNGRIDLLANYGAVSNPNADAVNSAVGGTGPQFLFQKTGTVMLGSGSITRILPTYASKDTAPGTELPEGSQIHIDGLAIHFDKNSEVFAPSGDVSVRAGTRTYTDTDGNRTIFDLDGNVESGMANHFTGKDQKFLYSGGQIYVDDDARISVAGSTDVFVSAEQSILTVDLRGAELADSPLQRDSKLRGVTITVDIRKSGTYNGRYWQGTPLADLTGLAGLVQRNVGQLTVTGGNVSLKAGDSIVVRSGSTIDVSGGYYRNEGGPLQTSALVSNGRLISIDQATPDRKYDGVFNGTTTITSEKWGVSDTYLTPLFGGASQSSYIEGAAGGNLTLTAAGMAIDGKLHGATIRGELQRTNGPISSKIDISFTAERAVAVPGGPLVRYITDSPTPADVSFAEKVGPVEVPDFALVDESPVALPEARLSSVALSTRLLGENGFGSLAISNPDGSITIPEKVVLKSEIGGSVKLDAANLTVGGSIVAHSGMISLGTYNISPTYTAESNILFGAGTVPPPAAATDRGLLTLGSHARIDATGLISNDLAASTGPIDEPISTVGGTISFRSYNTLLKRGSVVDVSGGVHVSDKGARSYGNGGSITLVSGTDDGYPGLVGGDLAMGASFLGYSGAKGGSLSIQASTLQVGSESATRDLVLDPGFFRKGGFTKFALFAIGERSDEEPAAGQFESYKPAIVIAADTSIRPLADSLVANIDEENGSRVRLEKTRLVEGLRSAVSIEFRALGSDDTSTPESIDIRGDLVVRAGSVIEVAPGANVLLKGQTITHLGSVIAPGGTITVSGSSAFPLTASQRLAVTQALPTVHLGRNAVLSAAGRLQRKPDQFGRRSGTVFSGGTINVTGNIVAESGSVMDVSGASAILDLNPSGIADNGVTRSNRPAVFSTNRLSPWVWRRGWTATRGPSCWQDRKCCFPTPPCSARWEEARRPGARSRSRPVGTISRTLPEPVRTSTWWSGKPATWCALPTRRSGSAKDSSTGMDWPMEISASLPYLALATGHSPISAWVEITAPTAWFPSVATSASPEISI
jgi:filamentous hemagglutinin